MRTHEEVILLLFKNKLKVEKFDLNINVSGIPTMKDARLVYVNGSGQLSSHTTTIADSEYGHRYLTQMTLNNTPLLKINAPSCPTCSSILATGYGIDKADCLELLSLQENINSEFISLDDSIETLKPLLALMKSGLYIIADAICYPVDGDGRFFWNVPNEPSESIATVGVLLPEADYAYVDGQPVFLYPTQDTDCFNSERVQYYIEKFKDAGNQPRAVVYNFGQFISFVIDGHHKACSASLLGIPLCCIIIIPFTSYGYQKVDNKMVPDSLYLSSIVVGVSEMPSKYLPPLPKQSNFHRSKGITAGTINHRAWEKAYLDSSKKYPTVLEYADMISAGISDISILTDDMIAKCISNLNNENQQKMKAILLMLANQNDPRLKPIAIACAKQLPYCKLKVQAYKALCALKNDIEVEQLLIDYLVDCEDKHDPILPIINSYWD